MSRFDTSKNYIVSGVDLHAIDESNTNGWYAYDQKVLDLLQNAKEVADIPTSPAPSKSEPSPSGRKEWKSTGSYVDYNVMNAFNIPSNLPAQKGGMLTTMVSDNMVGGNLGAYASGTPIYTPAKVYDSLFSNCGANILVKLFEARLSHAAAKGANITGKEAVYGALRKLEEIQKQLVNVLVLIDAHIKTGSNVDASNVMRMSDPSIPKNDKGLPEYDTELSGLMAKQAELSKKMMDTEGKILRCIYALPVN